MYINVYIFIYIVWRKYDKFRMLGVSLMKGLKARLFLKKSVWIVVSGLPSFVKKTCSAMENSVTYFFFSNAQFAPLIFILSYGKITEISTNKFWQILWQNHILHSWITLKWCLSSRKLKKNSQNMWNKLK